MNPDKYAFLRKPGTTAPYLPSTTSSCHEEVSTAEAVAIRLVLVQKSGQRFSYPYGQIGLISMPTAETLVLHCNCGLLDAITIRGRSLQPLAHLLDLQRLALVREAAHDFSGEGPHVSLIELTAAE
ncbi:MAG: hypothetical protein Q7P63_12225 [Verrucomicrobiota bacterium JB022]|nr:hypothetical protein [Verrucomicrobiota bacterium JB022]